jgi:hypothetical protein
MTGRHGAPVNLLQKQAAERKANIAEGLRSGARKPQAKRNRRVRFARLSNRADIRIIRPGSIRTCPCRSSECTGPPVEAAFGRLGRGSEMTAARVWGLSPEAYMACCDPWPLSPRGELLLGVKLEAPRVSPTAKRSLP